jgi:very-short-patch-repair endonuclease
MITIQDRTFKHISEEQLQYIKENYMKTASQLQNETGVDHRRVAEIIKLLNLRKRHPGNTNRPLNKLSEYEKDLQDPLFSHAKLARKWQVTPEAIGSARKRRGLGVWRTNQTSVIEEQVMLLLDKLDIVYLRQYRINKWSIDFYLGHKICLDVNGTWAHAHTNVIERDIRKANDLNSLGYYYFVVNETDLIDEQLLLEKLQSFYWVSLRSNAM